MFAKTLAVMGMASAATAHIIMTNPVPLGNPDSSPLLADGSNFPCKGPVTGGGSTENTYEQGSTQQLAFMGSAVHGGGSCQVSVTTDLNPTKDSVWKVIKSIEGGCPAQDTPGNLPENPNGEIPYKYDFTIPESLAAGDYVFAWSWFNKIGNREMYMNCAAVSVTGSGGADGFLDSLPDMFVANVDNGCGTTEGVDVEFPNPGQDVAQMNGATQAFGPPVGECGPTGGSPNPDPAPQPTTPPTEPAPTTVPGGIFITVTDAPVPTSAPETPEPEPQPEPQPEPVPENPGSGGNSAGSPCSTEGAWNCVDGSSFQRCASGIWSAVQPLSGGTTCQVGESAELMISARASKRVMRRGTQRIRA